MKKYKVIIKGEDNGKYEIKYRGINEDNEIVMLSALAQELTYHAIENGMTKTRFLKNMEKSYESTKDAMEDEI